MQSDRCSRRNYFPAAMPWQLPGAARSSPYSVQSKHYPCLCDAQKKEEKTTTKEIMRLLEACIARATEHAIWLAKKVLTGKQTYRDIMSHPIQWTAPSQMEPSEVHWRDVNLGIQGPPLRLPANRNAATVGREFAFNSAFAFNAIRLRLQQRNTL